MYCGIGSAKASSPVIHARAANRRMKLSKRGQVATFEGITALCSLCADVSRLKLRR